MNAVWWAVSKALHQMALLEPNMLDTCCDTTPLKLHMIKMHGKTTPPKTNMLSTLHTNTLLKSSMFNTRREITLWSLSLGPGLSLFLSLDVKYDLGTCACIHYLSVYLYRYAPLLKVDPRLSVVLWCLTRSTSTEELHFQQHMNSTNTLHWRRSLLKFICREMNQL